VLGQKKTEKGVAVFMRAYGMKAHLLICNAYFACEVYVCGCTLNAFGAGEAL
jgi:hypothetical protein